VAVGCRVAQWTVRVAQWAVESGAVVCPSGAVERWSACSLRGPRFPVRSVPHVTEWQLFDILVVVFSPGATLQYKSPNIVYRANNV
jgi:hypothetical protein